MINLVDNVLQLYTKRSDLQFSEYSRKVHGSNSIGDTVCWHGYVGESECINLNYFTIWINIGSKQSGNFNAFIVRNYALFLTHYLDLSATLRNTSPAYIYNVTVTWWKICCHTQYLQLYFHCRWFCLSVFFIIPSIEALDVFDYFSIQNANDLSLDINIYDHFIIIVYAFVFVS